MMKINYCVQSDCWLAQCDKDCITVMRVEIIDCYHKIIMKMTTQLKDTSRYIYMNAKSDMKRRRYKRKQ